MTMDRETKHELDNLKRGYRAALIEIDEALDDEAELLAWRKVQTLGFRLHELLPSVPA
jgi:hypothetical protein